MPLSDDAVMNGLLGKIYAIMAAPEQVVSGAAPRASTSPGRPPYVSFASPGIAIDELDFGLLATKEEVNRCSFFSDLVNTVPAASGTWRSTGTKVWDVYRQAITNIQLPNESLSQAEEDMLRRAEDFLYDEVTVVDPFTGEATKEPRASPQYKAYEQMFTAYSAALRRYNCVKRTALSDPTPENVSAWTDDGPILEREVRIAYERWGSLGYRDYVQRANAIIAQLTGRGSFAQYERLRQTFVIAEKKDLFRRSFWPTFGNPPRILGTAFDDAWTNFTFRHTEIDSYESQSRTSWGGGFSAGWGLWSASGSYSRTDEQTYSRSEIDNLELSVDLIQVPILRSWCEPWIFSSRGWKGYGPIEQEGCISDGSTPPRGLMPLLPTSLILARNLEIRMDMTTTENRSSLRRISSSFSGGWGPFTVKGNYADSRRTASSSIEADDTGLRFAGAQIIAFVCEEMPKTPYPDPSLDWSQPVALSGLAGSLRVELDDVRWLK